MARPCICVSESSASWPTRRSRASRMDEGRRTAMRLNKRSSAWRVMDATNRSSVVRAGKTTFAAHRRASARWIRSPRAKPSAATSDRSASMRLSASAENGTKPRWLRTRARMALSVAGRDKASSRTGGSMSSCRVRWTMAPCGIRSGSSTKRPARRRLHRCSAAQRRLSEPRARSISWRSIAVNDQSLRIWSGSTSSTPMTDGSAIEIERGLFDGSGQLLRRDAGVDGGGVEAFVTEQLCQLDQLAGMLAQPGQSEGVAQTVGGDAGARQTGAPGQGPDCVLDRAHRYRHIAGGTKDRILRLSGRILLKELAQRAAGGGVERHFAFLEALAMADAYRAGALAQGDVAATQGHHLPDPQTGLQHEFG